MENKNFENWEPKGKWVYYADGGPGFIGCHCVTPYDDCGCNDCQQRHSYKAWYDQAIRCFVDVRNGVTTLTAVYKAVQNS